MVVLLSFAAIVGLGLTFLCVCPYGWGVALASAPFGGSLAAVLMALLGDRMGQPRAPLGVGRRSLGLSVI
jgi:hypothetical protein